MNVAHYGNAFDVFKWSWLIDYARRTACERLRYVGLQTSLEPGSEFVWEDPAITRGHPDVAPKVAEFFRGEHVLFRQGTATRSLNRLSALLESVGGLRSEIDCRPYRHAAAGKYLAALEATKRAGRVLLVIDPDNGLCDPSGRYRGLCRSRTDRHVSVDDARAAVVRVAPHAVALTQYNTRKPGCFEDARRFFRTVGHARAKTELHIFRGRVVLAIKELQE